MNRIARALFVTAAVLALLSSLVVYFSAGATEVSETSNGLQTVRHLTWFEAQGWWGIAILFIFSALYYGPLRFHQRGRSWMVILFGLVAISLTFLAMFSIGLLYLPSALSVLFGLLFVLIDLIIRKNRAPD